MSSDLPDCPSHAFIRGRVGPDPSHGFYPAPHRYQLYVSLGCPSCLRLAIAHQLLGLDEEVQLHLLPAVPDAGDERGYAELRPAYASTAHRYPGPAAAPVLADRWSGRVVSNHPGDILRDLALRFRSGGRPELFPRGLEEEIDAVARLCEHGVTQAAQRAGDRDADRDAQGRRAALDVLLETLDRLEERVAASPFVLGEALTAADLHLWVTLVQLDTVHRCHLDAEAVRRIAPHPWLWAYARRLLADPAFGPLLHPEEIALRHHARCQGLEAAGAAVRIIDWTLPQLMTPLQRVRPHA